jgi:hypothetical protein
MRNSCICANWLATHRQLVQDLGKEADRQGLSAKQVMVELEKDKRAEFQATYGSNPG